MIKILLLAFLLNFSLINVFAEDVIPTLTENKLVPSFMLRDLSGKMVSIRDYCGKPRNRPRLKKQARYNLIISFMASYCVPCKREIPILEEYAKNAPDDVKIIYISIDSLSQNVMVSFAKKMNIKQTILLDKYGTAMKKFGVKKLPSLFIVNKKGELVYQNLDGFPKNYKLKEKINSVISLIKTEPKPLSLEDKRNIVSYVLSGKTPMAAAKKFNLNKTEMLDILLEANNVLKRSWK